MTVYGVLQILSVIMIIVGMFSPKMFRRIVLVSGVSIGLAASFAHFARSRMATQGYRLFSLPATNQKLILGSVIDERDFVWSGTKLFPLITGVAPFNDAFDRVYSRLYRVFDRPLVTPFFSSLEEGSSENWVMEFSSEIKNENRPAVYLHGAMGSFVIQCWLVAEVLRQKGYTTYCPALSFSARWFEQRGKQVLGRLLDFVKAKHRDQKILFLGLSNGANGLTEYRPELAAMASGFVYISGGFEKIVIDEIPTLMIWGQNDEVIPYDRAKNLQTQNPFFQLVSTTSDHSAFVRDHDFLSAKLNEWLEQEHQMRK